MDELPNSPDLLKEWEKERKRCCQPANAHGEQPQRQPRGVERRKSVRWWSEAEASAAQFSPALGTPALNNHKSFSTPNPLVPPRMRSAG